MNATEPETETTTEIQVRYEKLRTEAQIVSGLLREYAGKLASLNADMLDLLTDTVAPDTARRAAWLLDQGELLRKPLSRIISRGSGLLEHASAFAAERYNEQRNRDGLPPLPEHSHLDYLTSDELALRMREIEIHHHHMLRLAHEIRQGLETARITDHVKKLRVAAGLNAMKGGPLDPD